MGAKPAIYPLFSSLDGYKQPPKTGETMDIFGLKSGEIEVKMRQFWAV